GTWSGLTRVWKQIRHRPKRLYNESERPQRLHHVYPRTLNFGVCCCFWTRAFFAISSLPLALLVAAERESEGAQQSATLVVGGARGDDGDVHPADGVDLVVGDLREDQLLGDGEGVVAPAVERVRVEPAEVADAGDRDAHEPVVELPHPVAPERHLGADRVALAELEARDRLLGPGHERLLPRDQRELGDGRVDQRLLLRGAADAAVEPDLLHARHLHHVADLELVLERRHQLAEVALLEA